MATLLSALPPSPAIDQLLAAPDSLLVDGMKVSVEVRLSRDFMPFSDASLRALGSERIAL